MRRGIERCRTADLVLCPSRATADDLVAIGFDSERLRVVPWGVDAIAVSDADARRVRDRYSLPDRYVLFVGTIEPRKNLPRLSEAMLELDDDLPLLVVGADGWGEVAVRPEADVRFLGFVPDGDLPAIYSTAAAFAYPSLLEGFGLPILEAMAQGVPVVTSAGSSTEEVAGGAAVLVDPHDASSIAAGLDAALTDAAFWVERGRARAETMTVDASAAATVDAYRDVVA